jgi:hypothetical protein
MTSTSVMSTVASLVAAASSSKVVSLIPSQILLSHYQAMLSCEYCPQHRITTITTTSWTTVTRTMTKTINLMMTKETALHTDHLISSSMISATLPTLSSATLPTVSSTTLRTISSATSPTVLSTASPITSASTSPAAHNAHHASPINREIIAPIVILGIVVVGGALALFTLCCIEFKAQRTRRLEAAKSVRPPITPTVAEMQAVEDNAVTIGSTTRSRRTMIRSNTDATTNSGARLANRPAPISTRGNSNSAPAPLDAIESYPTAKDVEKYLRLTGQKKSHS